MKYTNSLVAVALSAVALSFFVWADQGTASLTTPQVLSQDEVRDKIESLGYSIKRMKWDYGRYEVKAEDDKGRLVELDVSAVDGSVIRESGK